MIYLLSESNICSLLDLDDHKNMDFYLKPVLSALSEKIKEHLKISDKKGKGCTAVPFLLNSKEGWSPVEHKYNAVIFDR